MMYLSILSKKFISKIKTMKDYISYDDFSVSKRVMKLSSSSLHFIYLNPYIYPSAHPPFVFWPRIDTHFLDLVEKQLEDVKDNDEVVFFCHYPLNLYFNFAKS